jgi:hypothetical protein
MGTDPAKRQVSTSKSSVIHWLLDSDASIRWQVLRDLIDAPADEVRAERARVASEQIVHAQGRRRAALSFMRCALIGLPADTCDVGRTSGFQRTDESEC